MDINFLTLMMTVEAAVEAAVVTAGIVAAGVVAEGGEVHQQYQARQRRPLEVRNRRQPEVGGFLWEMSLAPPQEDARRRWQRLQGWKRLLMGQVVPCGSPSRKRGLVQLTLDASLACSPESLPAKECSSSAPWPLIHHE